MTYDQKSHMDTETWNQRESDSWSKGFSTEKTKYQSFFRFAIQ